ncbi:MAG TPA: DUF5916 domain-containing protein [Gemmatimonadales bacterium]|nr:DUF5916 domain-containing protein [Gemmatimonadales bacterium]
MYANPLALATALLAQETPTGTAVAVPRITGAAVVVDGRLDEPVWARAAALRDFSQYLPNDDRPAEDSTVVLVWYSPNAIYFGIRAYQDSAGVRATLADRDKIAGDDYVEILLDTFNDRRQALVFGVNPLGAQADGALVDAPRQIATTLSAVSSGAYTVDLNPDYIYASKGRLTAGGYEVEVRIPFKTLRYQARDSQDWGVNVIRVEQATGHQHTWTRVLQSRASFLAQSGTLTGLTGLERGLVLDVTPEATSTVVGLPQSATGGWHYGGGDPRIGGTAKWGVTSTLSLAGTARPDFSQVEADVPQVQFDPRTALFFPEKRPFFLDGLELFKTPVQLIYTRRLVDPAAAVKLTGQLGATTIAALAGVDSADAAAGGDHPLLTVVRLRRNLAGRDLLGVVYTDRVDGSSFNRVAAVDARILLGPAWDLTVQSGASATRDSAAGPVRWAPMWKAVLVRSGRTFGITFQSYGVHGDFRAASGFLSNTGFLNTSVTPSLTLYGRPGSPLESFNANVYLTNYINDWGRPTAGASRANHQADFSFGVTLRGGWQLGTGISVETFGYPASLFANDWIERRAGSRVDTVPFTGQPHIPNLDLAVNIATPRFQNFSLTAFVFASHDENFLEWASARVILSTVDAIWRPTNRLRAELIYNHGQVNRRTDGSLVTLTRVPRLKIEYQLSRAVFLRVVGQYTANQVDSLRDDSRTNDPILVRDPATGTFTRTAASASNVFRIDWLFSYHPTPGTVAYLGYGDSLEEPTAFRFSSLTRVSDGFFAKLSYLWRF